MNSKSEVTAKSEPAVKQSKPYGKIVLTLQNCLLPAEKLLQTPSQCDGLDAEIEIDLRILGCELIQSAGILLKLPQVAMATGQVLFQRFYYSKSFVRHSMETTAMACICLASKIEEAPRRIRDVINVIHHLKQLKDEKPIVPLILDQYYINLKNQVIKAERRVLKELGFCVHVKHPHKLIVMFLRVLNSQDNSKLMQIAWNYMNDSLRTDVFVRYQPETVACACIYLTARILNIPLPKNPDWFSIFKVKKEDIHSVCYAVLNLYSRPKPDPEALNSAVDKLRKHYQDERSKARGTVSGNNSPTVVSPDSPHKDKQTGGSHNAWGGFISRSGSHTVPSEKHRKSKSQSPVRNSKKSRRRQSHSNSRSRSRSRSPLSRSRTPVEKYKNRSPSSYKRRSSSPYLSPKNTKKIRKSKYRSRSRSSEWKVTNESKSHKSHNSSTKRSDRYRDQNDEENAEKHIREERHSRYVDYDKYAIKNNEKHEKYHDRHSIRHSEKSAEKHSDSNHRSRGSSGKYHRSERDRSRDRRR